MKLAWWLGIGTILIVILLVATKNGERDRDIPEQSPEIPDEVRSDFDTIGSDAGITDSDLDTGIDPMATVPDWASETVPANNAELPPRTIFGIEPVKQSTILPVVDPATLSFDENIGRVEVGASASAGSADLSGALHPLSPANNQPIETDDGPLAGVIPRPDPSVPGPAIQTLSTGGPADVSAPATIMDPFGPGTPIDPEAAAVTPPNFVLPGADDSVQDPRF